MLAAVDVVFALSSLKISLVHIGSNLNNMELLLIPKISLEGLYFSRALSEGLMLAGGGGASIRWEILLTKSIKLAYIWKARKNYVLLRRFSFQV